MAKTGTNNEEVTKKSPMTFKEIYDLDLDTLFTKKDKLKYLSWADAVMKVTSEIDPNWSYEFEKFDNGNGRLVPYLYDETIGYMVYTKVTLNGITKEMCLPVMENHGNRNFAKKKESYVEKGNKYDTKISPCNMFDVNKTLMRCLVKNLAMFGLGLSVYQGEDTNDDSSSATEETKTVMPITDVQIAYLDKKAKELGFTQEKLSKGLQNSFKKKELKELTQDEGKALSDYFLKLEEANSSQNESSKETTEQAESGETQEG